MSEKVYIFDTTLRDGIQMPGISLCLEQKLKILGNLLLLGIKEAEIGCPARGAEAKREMQIMSTLFPQIHCSAWCRASTPNGCAKPVVRPCGFAPREH